MTPDRRTTIARHLAEADVALDAIDGDFVHDMGLYSTIQATKALRFAIAELADEIAELDPAEQPIPHVPTKAGLNYLAIRKQQNPTGPPR